MRSNCLFFIMLVAIWGCSSTKYQISSYFNKMYKKSFRDCIYYSTDSASKKELKKIKKDHPEVFDAIYSGCEHRVQQYNYFKSNSLHVYDSLKRSGKNYLILNRQYDNHGNFNWVSIVKILDDKCLQKSVYKKGRDSTYQRDECILVMDEKKKILDYVSDSYLHDSKIIYDYFVTKDTSYVSFEPVSISKKDIKIRGYDVIYIVNNKAVIKCLYIKGKAYDNF